MFASAPRILAQRIPAALSWRRGMSTATAVPTRSSRGVFSGLFGFLLGISVTGGVGYYYLLDEYIGTSHSLIASMEKLERSSHEITQESKRIVKLNDDLEKLRSATFTQEEAKIVKRDMEKLRDELDVKLTEIKLLVWNLEKQSLAKEIGSH